MNKRTNYHSACHLDFPSANVPDSIARVVLAHVLYVARICAALVTNILSCIHVLAINCRCHTHRRYLPYCRHSTGYLLVPRSESSGVIDSRSRVTGATTIRL